MKSTVYIETSVVSYYTGRPSRDLIEPHVNNKRMIGGIIGLMILTFLLQKWY